MLTAPEDTASAGAGVTLAALAAAGAVDGFIMGGGGFASGFALAAGGAARALTASENSDPRTVA